MNKKCFKLIVVGRQGAGKTSLINRFTKDKFAPNYTTTIGIEFSSKEILVDNEKILLQIWDTAGQEKFKSLIKSFYHNSICTIFVYSIDDRKSFEDLEHWFREAKESVMKDCILILVGTKKDMNREVEREEGMKFMESHHMDAFFETSAKSGEQVFETFQSIARELIEVAIRQTNLKQSVNSTQLALDAGMVEKKGCC